MARKPPPARIPPPTPRSAHLREGGQEGPFTFISLFLRLFALKCLFRFTTFYKFAQREEEQESARVSFSLAYFLGRITYTQRCSKRFIANMAWVVLIYTLATVLQGVTFSDPSLPSPQRGHEPLHHKNTLLITIFANARGFSPKPSANFCI